MSLPTFNGLLNCGPGSMRHRAEEMCVSIRPIIAIVAIAAAPG